MSANANNKTATPTEHMTMKCKRQTISDNVWNSVLGIY